MNLFKKSILYSKYSKFIKHNQFKSGFTRKRTKMSLDISSGIEPVNTSVSSSSPVTGENQEVELLEVEVVEDEEAEDQDEAGLKLVDEDEQGGAAQSFIDLLPGFVVAKIFGRLNLNDLKQCKQVCLTWYHFLEYAPYKVYSSKALCVYNAAGSSKKVDNWTARIQLFFFKNDEHEDFPHVYGSHFCIKHFKFWTRSMSSDVVFWLKTKASQITQLDLTNCFVNSKDFNCLFSSLGHLVSLNLTHNSQCMDDIDQNSLSILLNRLYRRQFSFLTIDKDANVQRNLSRLKKISISESPSRVQSQYMRILRKSFLYDIIIQIPYYCKQLESFEIHCGLGTPHRFERLSTDLRRYVKSLMKTIGHVLKANAATLKYLKISFFKYDDLLACGDLVPQLLNQNITDARVVRDKPMQSDNLQFSWFISNMRAQNWINYHLKLRKLELSFYMAQIPPRAQLRTNLDATDLRNVLYPFLEQQRSLREFRFGQLYPSFAFGHSPVSELQKLEFLQDFTYHFAISCSLHIQVLDQISVATVLPALQVGAPLRIEFTSNEILAHSDSMVYLASRDEKISWTFYYVQSRTLENSYLLLRLKYLTIIRITQIGVPNAVKLRITDQHFQRILTEGTNLKYLSIEYCDLSGMTDAGLTGLSPEACERIKGAIAATDFKIKENDFVGTKISSLKHLTVLKLSEFGNAISTISFNYGFTGLKLKAFEIIAPNLENEGTDTLLDCFKFSVGTKVKLNSRTHEINPPLINITQ